MAILNHIDELRREGLEEIAQAGSAEILEGCRVKWLGRKGKITEVLRGLGSAAPEERRALGQAANGLKAALEGALETAAQRISKAGGETAGVQPADFSLPGRRPPAGHLHLITQVTEEVVDIFSELGYQVAEGPDIESEYYNFDSMNTPADHPARDSHDTFYIEPGVVLRTHTSPVQMRVMERTSPPIAIVAPGRVYRVDYDASHSPMFFQIEGLLVDKGVTMADLKGTLDYFFRKFFGKEVKTRFRPHFFPFTEPSAEMDCSCTVCKGSGCRLCGNTGWLEILGCGMVHPEVFRYANYDYERYSGFAFGMGIDRLAILRHAIDSIQHLYENDLRFLEQF